MYVYSYILHSVNYFSIVSCGNSLPIHIFYKLVFNFSNNKPMCGCPYLFTPACLVCIEDNYVISPWTSLCLSLLGDTCFLSPFFSTHSACELSFTLFRIIFFKYLAENILRSSYVLELGVGVCIYIGIAAKAFTHPAVCHTGQRGGRNSTCDSVSW